MEYTTVLYITFYCGILFCIIGYSLLCNTLHRHAICHGCTDIIRVKYFLGGEIFALNKRCFAENSVFAISYGLLVTHLVSHRFTLGNPIIAIPIMYLLRVIKPWVYAVLLENVACHNLRFFWVTNYFDILSV